MPVPEVVSMPGAESTRKASKLPKFDGSSWTPHKKQALHHGSWSVIRTMGSPWRRRWGGAIESPQCGQHHQRGIP